MGLVKRELTGNFYLKKRWFRSYQVYVEINGAYDDPNDLSIGPSHVYYVKARPEDLIKLKIPVV